MRFVRDRAYDAEFEQIAGIKWYPYVGKNFGANNRRIMVYAHNIPIKKDDVDKKKAEWKDPGTWADCIDEYTYEQGWWTEAFRYFVKGAARLSENYNEHSSPDTLAKVDDFIFGIAYLNFIQDLVASDSQIANATEEQVVLSREINKEILRILRITHCICWGKPTYEYVRTISGFHAHSERSEGKTGFSSCLVNVAWGQMTCLRVHHPSMPRFDPYSKETQGIIANFLNR
jgi:hypothetical protein